MHAYGTKNSDRHLQSVNSPNLMLAKLSCFTVLLLSDFVSSHFSSTAIIAKSVKKKSILQSNLSPNDYPWAKSQWLKQRGGGGGEGGIINTINTVILYSRKFWQALNLLNWLSVGIG